MKVKFKRSEIEMTCKELNEKLEQNHIELMKEMKKMGKKFTELKSVRLELLDQYNKQLKIEHDEIFNNYSINIPTFESIMKRCNDGK